MNVGIVVERIEVGVPIDLIPKTRNRAFVGAFWKGVWASAVDGKPIDANPYSDHRGGKYGNIITYSRAFQRFWCDGWNAGERATVFHWPEANK